MEITNKGFEAPVLFQWGRRTLSQMFFLFMKWNHSGVGAGITKKNLTSYKDHPI